MKQSFMYINSRVAVLYPQRPMVRSLSLGTHLVGLKHVLKMPKEENTNTELVTVELEVAMGMSQHGLIMKREMTCKLEMTVLCSCLN